MAANVWRWTPVWLIAACGEERIPLICQWCNNPVAEKIATAAYPLMTVIISSA
jgi:hypothetical protein